MAFFPVELLRYKINISKDEMISRLNDNVEPKRFLEFSAYGKPYFGKVYKNGFKIMRHSIIQNSFRPIIIGNIIENGAENILEVLMRPYLMVLIFMSIILGILGIITPIIAFITSFDTEKMFASLIAIIIIILFLIISITIFYSIMVLFFNLESKQDKKFLGKLFEGNINIMEEENDIIKIITYVIKSVNPAKKTVSPVQATEGCTVPP